MEITVINGHPGPDFEHFDATLASLTRRWQAQSHRVTPFVLRELNIRPCIGCWDCWWATPGLCGVADDTHELRRAYVHADLVLLASPLIQGFPSALLKTVIDKLIPLYHPYIELEHGECVHRPRYDRYPALVTLVEPGPQDDAADLDVVQRYFERFAFHFRSRLVAQLTTHDSFDAMVRETERLAA
jgi:hypothetical protein